MSSYGELIQALQTLKNVKEKRHGIKTLSSLCANRAFQVRIVNHGGWSNAILPLIISLDEECRKYASLAIANLSTSTSTHPQLKEEHVLRHLVPILQSEEVSEVVVFVLNALGNFACSAIMWEQLRAMSTMETVVTTLKGATREEIKVNALFFLANLSADELSRHHMIDVNLYEIVWEHMRHPNFLVMQYALATLRGLSVESPIQETLPRLGIMPLLVGVFKSQSPQVLKTLVLDIILHLSFLHSNSSLLLDRTVTECITSAARSTSNPEFVVTAVAIIANLCENIELHDRLMETDLFPALSEHVDHDVFTVQQHVIRGFMLISLSPKYHHVLLATNVMAKVCMIAVADLPDDMRVNALELMAAVCATHPTVPTENDVMDLLYLICNEAVHSDIRRAAMLALANAASDVRNLNNLLKRPYIEALIITLSKTSDIMLVDYLSQFFHNIVKMDQKAGSMLIQCGYGNHMFTFERLESLSITSAIYVCDTCRHLVDDAVVRQHLLERMMFQTMLDAWAVYLEEPHIAPHLALMCSAFAFHADSHREFVMQHGVRLVIELYSRSEVEHVRLCCLLTMLYLADGPFAQRAISQERGIQLLLSSCEAETHIDLITNSLKALIPFASNDDYRPQLGMDGGIDTFASFLFSPHLPLQQLGVYLLQNLLELGLNRRIFLGIAEEKKTEEDYLQPLARFLPQLKLGRGTAKKKRATPKGKSKKKKDEVELTPHDPFVVRCVIHSIALLCLENDEEVRSRFIELNIPQTLYTLLYSEQIDKSSGEAIMLFFANLLHSSKYVQAGLLRQLDIIPMLLSASDMGFAKHTEIRCLSALVSIARTPEFKQRVLGQLELIMKSVNLNIGLTERDENFYCTTALHCTLLAELASSSPEVHEKMRNAGVMEAFLIFITIAGRGLRDEICVELLMGTTFGIATLCASPTCGEAFTGSLLYPATRLQLFVSLLRLPATDINRTFHLGTVGLRTLQRMLNPSLRPEELHIDNLDQEGFFDMCGIRPADFIYRNVVRTLAVVLAKPDLGRRVQEAISLQNVVPTSLFALRGTEDIFTQVLGYMLVARFTTDLKLQNAFVNDSSVMNEILTVCRRYSPDSATAARGPQESEAFKLASFGKAAGQWGVHAVNRNRYLLAMLTLANVAERVKEKYRNQDIKAGTPEQDGQLSYSNHAYLAKMTGTCLQQMDAEELLESSRIEELVEFTALLRVIVVHNSFLARIELDHTSKGGLVKISAPPVEYTRAEKGGPELVLPELRAEFKTLFHVQSKSEGLLNVVQKCLELEAGDALVQASVECLCAMTYLGPMSIKDPSLGFRVLTTCPTWIQTPLCCLFANTMSDPRRPHGDLDYLTEEDSSILYPLAATSPPETMRYVRGALANVAARPELFDFVVNSGVLRIYRMIEKRAHFCEDFAVILESTRILANLTSRPATHQDACNEHVISFLRDVLHHSSTLLKGDLGNKQAMPPDEDFINVTFHDDDAPPLGIRLRWEQPPKVVEIIPDLPAAYLEDALEEDDELIEVNGVDVQEMHQDEIAPMFEVRPLHLTFRRYIKTEPEEHSDEEEVVQEVQQVSEYGSHDEYLECFHLAMLTLHNLSTQRVNHEKILAEPKVLNTLLALIPQDVLLPSLRRLVFSLLTCLCQQKEMSGRIFNKMADYYIATESPDSSLQKYIVLSANLYYTSIDQVVPDRGMLVFVGRLASIDGMAGANQALVEILHRMAMGPAEFRGPFVCNETMVLTCQFIDLIDYPEIQCCAYEVAYFLTISNLQYNLWSSTELIPHMVKAAAAAEVRAQQYSHDDVLSDKMKKFEDAQWELTLRTLSMCLGNNVLLKQMILSELDRYLMKLFMASMDGDTGATETQAMLLKCAGHLMAGMLQSAHKGTFWNRWRSMGAGDKLVSWFASIKEALRSDVNRSLGESVDSILNLMLFALDADPTFLQTMGAGDVVSCISLRMLHQVAFYQQLYGNDRAPPDAELIVPTNCAFRSNAQMVSILTVSEKALDIMNKMNLAGPLVSLLTLPKEDYREPALVITASLCAHQATCGALMRSTDFKGILKELTRTLEDPKARLAQEEFDYFSCILDRACSFQPTANLAQQEHLHLLCLLTQRADSMDSVVLSLRAIAHCAFENAACLDALAGKDIDCLHYIMAINRCLHFEMAHDDDGSSATSDGGEAGMEAVARRNMMARVSEQLTNNPFEARLVRHFARSILCEAVSISRPVCQGVFADLDMTSLLADLTDLFNLGYERIDVKEERLDLVMFELANDLNATLHIILSAIFQGGADVTDDKEPRPKIVQAQRTVTDALRKTLDSVHGWLKLDETHHPQDQTPSVIGGRLSEDMRSLFLVTALMREICAKPANSIFLRVVRSRKFTEVLEGCIRVAMKLFKKSLSHPDAGHGKQERNSPFNKHFPGISHLPFIFEHLLVCMRHQLAQCMYIPTPDMDFALGAGVDEAEPWCWVSQDQLDIHKTSIAWIPDLVKRFRDEPGITMEVVRYISAVATFYVAPVADPGRNTADPERKGRVLCDIFALKELRLLLTLTAILESEEDPCTVTLATLVVGNLSECERERREKTESKEKLPIPELISLTNALIRVMGCVPKFPREMSLNTLIHCLRSGINFLAMEDISLSFDLLRSGYWDSVKDLFKEYFRDVYKVQSVKDYTSILQLIVQFVRNWVTVGNMVDRALALDREQKGRTVTKLDKKHADEIDSQLGSAGLLNFLVNAVWKLADTPRQIPDKTKVLTEVFNEAIMTMQTILYRQSTRGNLDWKEIEQDNLERLLQCMLEHRREQSGVFEDPPLINIMFLMTKLGVRYHRVLFPDYLMHVAYGPREHHTDMQDIAAVCCAIISTQKTGVDDSQTAQVNIASVVENCAEFIRSLSEVPDPLMRLWHFRTITQWSQRPKVLDEVAASEEAIRYIVSLLPEENMSRYSVIFLHNISVLRCRPLLKAHGCISFICEAYRRYCKKNVPGPDVTLNLEAEAQRRMLQNLLLAMVRNCFLGSSDLHTEMGDVDLQAVVHLADCIATQDIGLYLATLLYVCHNVPPERAAKFIPTHAALVDLLVRLVLERDQVPAGGFSSTDDLYNLVIDPLKPPEEEEEEPAEEDEMEKTLRPPPSPQITVRSRDPGSPTRVTGLGKKASLYQRQRQARTPTRSGQQKNLMAATMATQQKRVNNRGEERRYQEQVSEYVYFAAAEILTHVTFRAEEPMKAEGAKAEDKPPDVVHREEDVSDQIRPATTHDETRDGDSADLVHDMIIMEAGREVQSLGMAVNVVSPPPRVSVDHVIEGGWAAQHGLVAGADIKEVNDTSVEALSPDEFWQTLRERPLKLLCRLPARRASRRDGDAHDQVVADTNQMRALPDITRSDEDATEVRDAISAAFANHSITSWLKFLESQAHLHDGKKIVLSNLFVHVTAKFLWHCWSNILFVFHFDTPVNIKIIAELIPFFLNWREADVHPLLSEVCLRARLHQYPSVCEYLASQQMKFPELACSVLSHAFVDTECPLSLRQSFEFLKVFTDLLRRRSLSRAGLYRLAVSIMIALRIDHPTNISAQLMQKEHKLLGDLLEQLSSYVESGTVKQTMVVMLALTVGRFYKPLNDLDGFVLRMLDMAAPLLESEFVLFMPVLHRLAHAGGKRVQAPILSKHLHMRVARILEDDVDKLEGCLGAGERVTADPGPNLNLCQRIQWSLVFFSTLGVSPASPGTNGATGTADNLQFDSFVCVDLMPVLVRVLKAAPSRLEALCAGFLLSSVSGSPCIVPHMPGILNSADRAFPEVLKIADAARAGKSLDLVDEPKWEHVHMATEQRSTLAMRRNLINLLANASYQPILTPPLLGSPPAFEFFSSLNCERYTFDNVTTLLHTKLFVVAQMCSTSNRDSQQELFEAKILDVLGDAEPQLEGELVPEGKQHPCDIRLLWIHSIVSLTLHSGMKMLRDKKGSQLIISAMHLAEALLRENRGLHSALGLVLEAKQALASAVGSFCKVQEFGAVRQEYILYLLGVICSAPVTTLRLAACEHLIETVSKGYRADISGAVLLQTNCIESFKSIICGPLDDLASSVTRVMIAFAQSCTYDVYVKLLENLSAVMVLIGDPNANPVRVLWLAELFSALTKERTFEVFDTAVELPSIVAFLSLARAQQARKREIVQHWLENYGSSLYEIDEVIAAFQVSTFHGLFLIASRCSLDPPDAKELRRVLFGVIYTRIVKWRDTVFGITEFLSSSLIEAMLPMCELQPDLTAAVIALFHSFITRGEHIMIERVWAGGHFLWLCKRLTHKSEAQKAIMQTAPGATAAVARMKGAWPKHVDLIVTQGMTARLLSEFLQVFPLEVSEKTVTNGGAVKTWQDYATYYFHYPWPSRDGGYELSKDVEQATESVILLVMRFLESVFKSVDVPLQQTMIHQNLLGLCLTVLLPSPEVQKTIQQDLEDDNPPADASDVLLVPEAKMMAGAIVARMTHVGDTYSCIQDRHHTHQSVSMFAQLHHWKSILFDDLRQGRGGVVASIGLVERCSTLFLNLLSVTSLDWLLVQMGLGKLEALVGLLLDFWCRHPNAVMQHYALRLFGSFVQVKELYVAVMAHEHRAVAVKEAIHRMFGLWDVRELRHVLRILCAAFGHGLRVPVLPSHLSVDVNKALAGEGGAQRLRNLLGEGGDLRATEGASNHLLMISMLTQVLQRSEQPGDTYCRVWSLWLVLVMMTNCEKPGSFYAEVENLDRMFIMAVENPDKEKLARRAKLLAEQEAVNPKRSATATLGKSIAMGKEDLPPCCRIGWLKESTQLNIVLARMAAFTVDGKEVLHSLVQPEKAVQLNGLLLVAILSCMRLPLRAQTLSADFLQHFYDLQEAVLEGVVTAGEGPYELLASWMRRGLYGSGTPVEADFRALIVFIMGQGLVPPLATVPSLNVDSAERPEKAPGGARTRGEKDDDELPVVCECPPPPEALLARLSAEILEEDRRLKQSQVPPPRNEGPLFSTMLCHLVYALACMVPFHAKAAAFSSVVRGAAFSQLMKTQNIIAQGINARQLLDPADAPQRAKLYMYARATACIRAALQSIMGSWFAADFGAQFSISEEGGQDFVQYCTKHIIQVYNNKIALTRVLGSPWQRVMMTQGPTTSIAELLLVLCSSDNNLQEVGRLGGQQALHALSKYGETVQTRQQATMLLTKLAVLDAPAPRLL